MLKKLYLDSFRGLSREVWLLALVSFINRAGTMIIPFLSIYLEKEIGLSTIYVGYVIASFGAGSVVGTFIGGLLTDKIGYRKVMFWSLFLSGFLFIGLQYITTFWSWMLLIFIATTVSDAFRPANLTSVAVLSKPENRTRSVSLIRLAINAGWTIGPAIAGVLVYYFGYEWLFWGDGVTCILAALFFLKAIPDETISEEDDPVLETTTQSKSVYSDRFYLIFVFFIFISAIAFFQLFSTIALFYETQVHLNPLQIGALMAMNGCLIALTEMPIVYVLEKKNINLQLAAFGSLLIGASYFVLGFSSWWVVAVISMLLVTAGEIFQMPFSNAFALNRPRKENRGQYMALYGIAYSGAFIVAPILGTHLIEYFGWEAMWFSISVFGLIGAIGLWFLGKNLTKNQIQKRIEEEKLQNSVEEMIETL